MLKKVIALNSRKFNYTITTSLSALSESLYEWLRLHFRHHLSDPSRPEFSSDNGNKVGVTGVVTDVLHNSDEQTENFDPGSCIGECSVETTYECPELAIEVSRTLSYDCGSPDCSATPCHRIETNCVSELDCPSNSVVPAGQEVSEARFLGSRVHLEGITNIEQNKEGGGRDWESLISDAAGLLIFDSPNDIEASKGRFQESLDPGTRLCASLISGFTHDENNHLQITQAVDPVGLEQNESENPPSQIGEEGHLKDLEATRDILASTSINTCVAESSEQQDNEVSYSLYGICSHKNVKSNQQFLAIFVNTIVSKKWFMSAFFTPQYIFLCG